MTKLPDRETSHGRTALDGGSWGGLRPSREPHRPLPSWGVARDGVTAVTVNQKPHAALNFSSVHRCRPSNMTAGGRYYSPERNPNTDHCVWDLHGGLGRVTGLLEIRP